MSARVYAAVHLGDDAVSVLVGGGDAVQQHLFETAVTMRAGTLAFLRPEGDAPFGERERSTPDVERCPWAYIDDDEVLVGSTAVPTTQVIEGTIADALARSGVRGPVDLLEVVCPSVWGEFRQTLVRTAVAPLAREVTVLDAASAAVRSLGERAPSSAVVIELGDVDSTVSTLTLRSSDGVAHGGLDVYERSGRWDAVGVRDVLASGTDSGARSSIDQRVSGCAEALAGRGTVDVFLVDTSIVSSRFELQEGSPHRVHRLSGPDLVRSTAAEAGVSDNGAVREESPREQSIDVPRTARAAAWLDDVSQPSAPERPRAMLFSGVAAAVILTAVAVASIFRFGSDAPTPVASPARPSVPTATPATEPGTLSEPAVPDDPSATSQPRATEPRASSSTTLPPDSSATSGPQEAVRFDFGRASVELPSTWSERVEPTRMLLVPPDLPERRIVVATVELRGGTTFDDVADDLEVQLTARGGEGAVGSFTRATDFGGRIGISYIESPGDDSVVHWRIFVEDGLQISIGCQSSSGAEDVLDQDCARAVTTLAVTRSR